MTRCPVCVSLTKPDRCPQFESPEPLLIPVGFEIPVSFQGRNLDSYTVRSIGLIIPLTSPITRRLFCVFCLQGRRFTIGTELMKHTEKEVTQEQGSKFKFAGYQVSVGGMDPNKDGRRRSTSVAIRWWRRPVFFFFFYLASSQ